MTDRVDAREPEESAGSSEPSEVGAREPLGYVVVAVGRRIPGGEIVRREVWHTAHPSVEACGYVGTDFTTTTGLTRYTHHVCALVPVESAGTRRTPA